jgi:hypothetical protein
MTKTASSRVVPMRITRRSRGVLVSVAAVTFSVVLSAMWAPSSQAQRTGGFVVSQTGRGGGAGSQAAGLPRGRGVRAHRARHHSGALSYSPYFYPDYETDEGDPAEPPTRVITQAAPIAAAPAPKAADAVVMELRGNHWVRLTSMGPMEVNGGPSSPSSSERTTAFSQAESGSDDNRSGNIPAFDATYQTAAALPAAVLVFRDGHREDAAKYTIVGGVIYLKADYWSNGAWTRKVSIADLDVPATLKENQSRGTHFTLPSRPYEVMMRP